jgi:uncharacterized protein
MALHKSYPVASFKALDDDDQSSGTFEALVSIFGNVDLVGDRVVKGAFKQSLKRWRDSDAPIPVIWSHQWDNLDAHVGVVLQAEERDEGLWVKARLDLEEDFARRLWKKLRQRAVKDFSFAYDILDEKQAEDGANELLELEILEVGPDPQGGPTRRPASSP